MDADILDGKRTRDPNFEVDDDVKRRRTEPTGLTQLDIPASIAEAMTGVPPPIPPSDTASIPPSDDQTLTRPAYHDRPAPVSRLGLKPALPELPPSLELVAGVKTDLRARKGFVGQEEVGIIGYAGPAELKGVEGVIKQRFTDFLVHEVLPSGEVLRLKDIAKPTEPEEDKAASNEKAKTNVEPANGQTAQVSEESPADAPPTETPPIPDDLNFPPRPNWPTSTTAALRPHFADSTIIALHTLLVEGKNVAPKQDAGWGSHKPRESAEEKAMNVDGETEAGPSQAAPGRGQGRDRGRGQGGRGGRGGGRGGSDQWWLANGDHWEVVSQPIPNKEDRTTAHRVIRELFHGLFETSARDTGRDGQKLVIQWARKNGRKADGGWDARDRGAQRKQQPYIHFTMHKSNRETQDCLGNLSRLLNVQNKDLSVCGTKDKRAVTVQRVCLKRGARNLVGVWRTVNGIKLGRRTEKSAVEERGERGCRIGDLEYSNEYLDLGMLKGNHFGITLRNVQAESEEAIDKIMRSLRDRGFINFYGMQRFGTSTVPTHVTGLHILRNNWSAAVDSLLSLREGEHPDCIRARLHWLEDGDYEKALEVMPRRSVAERNVWEFWKRGGNVTDRLGALRTIPRNLRTMYVHAYQSYLWNLVVSERIKLSATEPLVGDLVFEGASADEEPASVQTKQRGSKGQKRNWETTSSQDVKQLTEAELSSYTIFDVVMPLPGFDVDYPSGRIGELYLEIMRADGLDPHRMRREQREYSLPGSYRRIINHPDHVSWQHIQYTDPDIALVQSDEDRILGLNPAAVNDPEGKFRALRIELTLGASAYATMALREVTREETSVWHQIGLTLKSEDQGYKGGGDVGEGKGGDADDVEVGEGEVVDAGEVEA